MLARQAAVPPHGPTRSIAVTLFNLKYSPNLGDGIIAECLERELGRRLPGANIKTLDLAGRSRWETPRGGARTAILTLLQRAPRWLGDLLVSIALGSTLRRLRPRWGEVLRHTDVVVFGGGQLIQDADLNFPLKLAAAAAECRLRHIPIVIFGVGAASCRSQRGRRLVATLTGSPDLIHVAARDECSARELSNYGINHPTVSRDPAVLAARHWPAPACSPRQRPRTGLCITHPAVLRHHSITEERCKSEGLRQLYPQLVRSLVRSGHDVVLFSNGAAEDESLKQVVHRTCQALHGPRVVASNRCNSPGELVQLISGLDAVIAHRLHACIVAFSYGIPVIGLQWDRKLNAFFSDIGKSDYAIQFDEKAILTIPALLVRARAEGAACDAHVRILAEADVAIDRLAEVLTWAANRKAPRVAPHAAREAMGAAACN